MLQAFMASVPVGWGSAEVPLESRAAALSLALRRGMKCVESGLLRWDSWLVALCGAQAMREAASSALSDPLKLKPTAAAKCSTEPFSLEQMTQNRWLQYPEPLTLVMAAAPRSRRWGIFVQGSGRWPSGTGQPPTETAHMEMRLAESV
ncbi:hypothetical protein SRHO_G00045100 [Serrasalmus rhombeus]